MKKRLLSLLLVLCMVLSIAPFTFASEVPTEKEAFEIMAALEEEYPEGTEWTNETGYNWKGYSPANGVYWGGGYGCVAFAFLLSDAAFGDLPARELTNITIDDVRVGDILRINNDSHSVIILEVHDDHVILAEGNYMGTIHWGRKLTADEVAKADYMLTRYPENYTEPEVPDTVAGFTDVISGSYYEDAVVWAVENEVTQGRSATTFAPEEPCKRSEVVTFLHRVQGNPVPSTVQSAFTDVQIDQFYTDAVAWAVENEISKGMGDGIFGVERVCTRAQVVTFLWRTAGSPAPESDECPFTDVVPDNFYYEAVLWAVENGITKGMTDTEFGVEGTCTRAQIVTFLHRFAG